MDIICITGGTRPKLLEQTLSSMRENALDWSKHTLTLVLDNTPLPECAMAVPGFPMYILSRESKGTSASRNIGASSIPKYRRQQYLMLVDDDTYLLPCWDFQLTRVLEALPGAVVSGHAHPFNHHIGVLEVGDVVAERAGVLSTVHLAMGWGVWDRVGFMKEPGGPGGSEDVEWCARAVKLGYMLAVTRPMCAVHTGLTSSGGKQIVGYDLMVKLNQELVEEYSLSGKVVWE